MRGSLVAVLAVALAAAGCSAAPPVKPPAADGPSPEPAPAGVCVLLADPDGVVGRVAVSNQGGTAMLEREGEAAVVEAADRAPRAAGVLSPGEIDRLFGRALAAQPSPPERFVLRFEADSTELTGESGALLEQVVASVRRRSPADMSVVGHTDTAGDAERNLALGLRRAQGVADRLAALGASPSSIEIASRGETEPLVATADGVSEPQNRRVEVVVR